ncbi:MAG: MFS transporter [Chloroflexaceae bacterium]|nr:MFS transporter [Chloroflexaceae bacterium]
MTNIVREPCDEGVMHSSNAVRPCGPAAGRWVLVATILGSSMAFIDGSVVNVALPALRQDLQATTAQVQWVVESYALVLAALILLGGSLGDHLGRRRSFGVGVAIFAVASAWCGMAPDAPQLVAARALQGLGAALLVPGSLALISASFADAERGRAIGTWSAASAITSAVGPVLGGFLVEQASWRWVFFINLPLALVVLAVLWWRVPEQRSPMAGEPLDWWGALLVTLGLGGLVFGLIEVPYLGFSNPLVFGPLLGGVLLLGLFLLVEARSQQPMLPLALFRSRTFSGANLLTLLLYAALGGALFFVPFNLIQVQGYGPTAAGAALLPLILCLSLLSRWAGGLTARFGAKLPLVVGPLVAAVGFGLFALPGLGGSYWVSVFPAALVLGLGMAVTVAPLTTTVMGAVDERNAGIASGINNAAARVAGLLAIAMFGLLMATVFGATFRAQLASLNLAPDLAQNLAAQSARWAGIELPAGLTDADRAAVETLIAQAFLSGYRLVMLVAAGLALAGALSAALLVEGKTR